MLYYSLPKAQDQVCITFANHATATYGVDTADKDMAAELTVDNRSGKKVKQAHCQQRCS